MSAENSPVPGIDIYDAPEIQTQNGNDMMWVIESSLDPQESLPQSNQVMQLDELQVIQTVIKTPDGKVRECTYDDDMDVWFYTKPVINQSGRVKFKKGLPVLERINL
jgi:hypothetical protein